MTREEAKKMLPILVAFAEGKTIQSRCIKGDKSLWYDDKDPSFDDDFEYRIKPEPKYRPFKDTEECWAEMQKHQPFGFTKFKNAKSGYYMVTCISSGIVVGMNNTPFHYESMFDTYTFADGTPFGVKVEES